MAARTKRAHHTYWLISAPGDDTFTKVSQKVGERGANLASAYRFEIPRGLRVGTLDDLMSLSDDLEKMELSCSSTAKKIGSAYLNLLRESQKAEHPSLQIKGQELDFYVTNFNWNSSKHLSSSSCREIANNICGEIEHIEDLFRQRLLAFNDANTKYSAADRSQKSNLVIRDLSDIVTPAHVTAGTSVLLTTVFAVVPNFSTKEWEANYASGFGCELIFNPDNHEHTYFAKPHWKPPKRDTEAGQGGAATSSAPPQKPDEVLYREWEDSLKGPRGFVIPAVVPDSSTLITSDSEYSLYNVTIFRECLKDFTNRAREHRFTIREFTPAEVGTPCGSALVESLKTDREEAKNNLIQFCQGYFPEVFFNWIHLKALNTFVQSLLRFGVPPSFQAIVLAPHQSGDNAKLRQALGELFSHLSAIKEETGSNSGTNAALFQGKVYPYVYSEIDLAMH